MSKTGIACDARKARGAGWWLLVAAVAMLPGWSAVGAKPRPAPDNGDDDNRKVPLRAEPLDPADVDVIRALPLGITIRSDEYEAAKKYLRAGDHVIFPRPDLPLMKQIPAGIIKILYLKSSPARNELGSDEKEAVPLADMVAADDTKDVAKAKFLRKVADEYRKKVFICPTGATADKDGPDGVKIGAAMAPYCDVFLIQSQRWLLDDPSRDLKDYCDHVHKMAGLIHAANPKAEIWLQVGRRLERGGGNAGLFAHAYAKVKTLHPDDFTVMHPFIGLDVQPPPPQHGLNALKDFLEALRPGQK